VKWLVWTAVRAVKAPQIMIKLTWLFQAHEPLMTEFSLHHQPNVVVTRKRKNQMKLPVNQNRNPKLRMTSGKVVMDQRRMMRQYNVKKKPSSWTA
jgi:hypothetical protein